MGALPLAMVGGSKLCSHRQWLGAGSAVSSGPLTLHRQYRYSNIVDSACHISGPCFLGLRPQMFVLVVACCAPAARSTSRTLCACRRPSSSTSRRCRSSCTRWVRYHPVIDV